MAEIVNLRRLKKARARDEAATLAASNRARHGRTRAEREATEAETRRTDKALDGALLTPAGDREDRE